ncbi:unnamed protein product [Staurois parvus]|uniref:Uncharacterized protein n=1 Tax=Staurois parvus TaxID=386267 RepID=A0ABN9D5S9_9NEOB|nr:unnamed protein product [Staurois parvus]
MYRWGVGVVHCTAMWCIPLFYCVFCLGAKLLWDVCVCVLACPSP